MFNVNAQGSKLKYPMNPLALRSVESRTGKAQGDER